MVLVCVRWLIICFIVCVYGCDVFICFCVLWILEVEIILSVCVILWVFCMFLILVLILCLFVIFDFCRVGFSFVVFNGEVG